MATILVTGGTGTLGRPTVDHLRASGHEVDAAVDGVDTIVHLATGLGRRDVQQTRNLLQATPGSAHVVVMSIVGIDRIPLPYYRSKLEVERLVAESGTPYTILRATQFHNLLDRIFSVKLPAILAPAITLQPIAVEDVAVRLTELVAQPVDGRAPDIGGPERRQLPEFARAWATARGSRRPVVPLRVPGKTFRAYASGASLVDEPTYGTITFTDYLGGKA
jgi:uncharacterized protein YbjT (DUF2867 family)